MSKISSTKKIGTPLYGLVLTGGKSTRMREDKSLLNYHGKTQVEFCYELLKGFCEKVFISNRKDQSSLPGHKGLPQIHDHKNYLGIGPLAGILSALKEYPKVSWLVLACDLPFVTSQTIETLIKNRNPKRLATAYKSTHNQLPEPLCAIYEPNFRPAILKFLKQGLDCPRKIMINSAVELLAPIDPQALENINNPQEMKAALALNKVTRDPWPVSRTRHEPRATSPDIKKIHIQYYALLREERGISHETFSTSSKTARDLYFELQKKFKFKLSTDLLRVAINDEFAPWDTLLKSDDRVVFIPPVAGG